jgi:hypothetical protein
MARNSETTQYDILEAIEWKLKPHQTLRQALAAEAEKDLDLKGKKGSISVSVDGDYFLVEFIEHNAVDEI